MLFVSAGEDKALAYAGVPQDLSKQLPAGGCPSPVSSFDRSPWPSWRGSSSCVCWWRTCLPLLLQPASLLTCRARCSPLSNTI